MTIRSVTKNHGLTIFEKQKGSQNDIAPERQIFKTEAMSQLIERANFEKIPAEMEEVTAKLLPPKIREMLHGLGQKLIDSGDELTMFCSNCESCSS